MNMMIFQALNKQTFIDAMSVCKHIDLCHYFVREAIQEKIISVQDIPTTEMTVDSLTKALGCEMYCSYRHDSLIG